MATTAAGFFLAIVALSCGKTTPSPSPAPPAPATSPARGDTSPASPAAPSESNPAQDIHGRILGVDTAAGASWSAGILEFRPTDPEVSVVAAARPGPDGRFAFVFSTYRWDVPYAVVAFHDANGNGQIDPGEDFVGGESRAGDYRGKNLFLIARAGTFVGDRPLDLDNAEFILDVRGK